MQQSYQVRNVFKCLQRLFISLLEIKLVYECDEERVEILFVFVVVNPPNFIRPRTANFRGNDTSRRILAHESESIKVQNGLPQSER